MSTAINVPAGFRVLPLPLVQLSLAAVLKCGQSFRWTSLPLHSDAVPTHEYRLCLRDRVVCLRQSHDALFYRSHFPGTALSHPDEDVREAETLGWIKDYFQLDVDLVNLYDEWSKTDPVFRSLRSRFAGIRMLRQDPWENLVSFICSSNNHIGRITKMVQALCSHYSPALLSLPVPSSDSTLPQTKEWQTCHPFPSPSVLAAPNVANTLRSLGFGYRADFIQRTAKMLVDSHGSSCASLDAREAGETWLTSLRNMDTEQAREELLKFVGVGRKVADCVLLMSMDKVDVIPVDTHVHQIAIKHYGLRSPTKVKANMTPKLYDEVNSRLVSVWGAYAGWAHSVLFTADLKSFSAYGLRTPSPAPSPSRSRSIRQSDLADTCSPSPRKGKRRRASTPSKGSPEGGQEIVKRGRGLDAATSIE